VRFARFEHGGAAVTAAVLGRGDGTRLHALRGNTSITDLALAGAEAAAEAVRWASAHSMPIAPGAVRVLPPVTPPSLRDFVAFEEHVEGVVRSVSGDSHIDAAWYEAPTFYFGNPHTLIGAQDAVSPPRGCGLLDFELEVAAVVGRGGRDLDPQAARDHIFGYTVLNDWSARDVQGREMKVGLGPAKGKDFATTLGPWIVTPDELEPYRDDDGFLALELDAYVNDRHVGHDLLSNAGWTFEEMVAYASRDSWVAPGDVLGSGTCGNGGCLAELWGRSGTQDPPPLAAGDVVRLVVEGIGEVSNLVSARPTTDPDVVVPTARTRDRARHRRPVLAEGALS